MSHQHPINVRPAPVGHMVILCALESDAKFRIASPTVAYRLNLRYACSGFGDIGPNAFDCTWRPYINASVQRPALTNPVFLRRDVFREKAGTSAIFPNFQAGSNTQSFTRSWTTGTSIGQTTEFGRSVSATFGLDYQGLGASVSGTLSQTFGTSITIDSSQAASQTYTMTIAGNTTAVFEVWNLTEQYIFVNADGTPYADPNYTFVISDLTRKATLATAWTSIEFPNN